MGEREPTPLHSAVCLDILCMIPHLIPRKVALWPLSYRQGNRLRDVTLPSLLSNIRNLNPDLWLQKSRFFSSYCLNLLALYFVSWKHYCKQISPTLLKRGNHHLTRKQGWVPEALEVTELGTSAMVLPLGDSTQSRSGGVGSRRSSWITHMKGWRTVIPPIVLHLMQSLGENWTSRVAISWWISSSSSLVWDSTSQFSFSSFP